MKRVPGSIATLALILTGANAAQAQFGSGIVFDPTQAGHAITQIQQGQQLFTSTVKIADNAIAAYNLAHQMSLAPQQLYQPYLSPSTYWQRLNQTANTYGNSQAVINAANTGVNTQSAYQLSSVSRTGTLPDYSALSTQGQQQIAAQAATTDLSDAIAESNLQTLGTMRANEMQREQDISALESESHSINPAQQTDMATMQRMNQAMLLQLRQQQEANQIQQAVALQQMIMLKQQQDVMKQGFQDAAGYSQYYQTNIAPAYNGEAQALMY
jgi:hypothetical protein